MSTRISKQRERSGIRLPLWGLLLLVLAILIIFVGSTVWLFRTVQGMASAWEITNPDFGAVSEPVPDNAVVINEPSAPAEDDGQRPLISTEALKPWSGTERVTILLLGVDQRCAEDGPTHTDSLMLVTVDPIERTASLLSLPRDLWVEIPGFEVDRINQAYYKGQVFEYPGGGEALAVETVETALGIPIDYYLSVNFQAFIQVVDLIGGIEVEVPETIDDPDYPDRCYGFDPFHIEAGTHRLDGSTALKYARTRATFGGDVDRAERQQQVMLAVREQVLQLDMIPQLMGRAPELWQTLQENVRTNLSLEEAAQLALLVQEIPRENIRTAVIDFNYVYAEVTPDGRQVLVLLRDKMRNLRDELFAPAPVPTPVFEDLPALMAEEKARVAVYNGTSVFGLAASTQSFLERNDITVAEIGNADSATYRSTQIIDYGEHPNTVLYLTQLMNIPPLNASNGSNPAGDFDILIILGDDWRVSAP